MSYEDTRISHELGTHLGALSIFARPIFKGSRRPEHAEILEVKKLVDILDSQT